jgi:hypothetical protein
VVVVAMKNGEIHRNGIYTLAICCGAMNCHIKAPSGVELQVQLLRRIAKRSLLGRDLRGRRSHAIIGLAYFESLHGVPGVGAAHIGCILGADDLYVSRSGGRGKLRDNAAPLRSGVLFYIKCLGGKCGSD